MQLVLTPTAVLYEYLSSATVQKKSSVAFIYLTIYDCVRQVVKSLALISKNRYAVLAGVVETKEVKDVQRLFPWLPNQQILGRFNFYPQNFFNFLA